jgi:hypothetical protein
MEKEKEQQYEMQYPQQIGGYTPREDKSDLLDKIRPEEIIEQIKQRLMGKEWDPNEERWVTNPALRDIALTDIGASSITNLMFPASTRSVSISNLKDEEIKKRLLSLIRTAMKMCLDNWESYGIKHTSQIYFVKEIVYTNTLVVLKQPENEGIRRLLNSVISENRSVSTYGEERSGGILNLFKRR